MVLLKSSKRINKRVVFFCTNKKSQRIEKLGVIGGLDIGMHCVIGRLLVHQIVLVVSIWPYFWFEITSVIVFFRMSQIPLSQIPVVRHLPVVEVVVVAMICPTLPSNPLENGVRGLASSIVVKVESHLVHHVAWPLIRYLCNHSLVPRLIEAAVITTNKFRLTRRSENTV